MILTPRQANIMDHATRYPKFVKNRITTENGTLNEETCKQLEQLGYLKLCRKQHVINHLKTLNKQRYDVTKMGFIAVLKHHGDVD